MKKTYLLFGLMVCILLTMTPVINAVEYNNIKDYTINELQNMDIQELRELVNENLGDEQPTGIITIVVNLLFTVVESLFYIVPAIIYLLITIII